MKKTVFLILVPLMIACGGNKGTDPATVDPAEPTVEPTRFPEGEAVYLKTCVACHQANGEGVAGAFPPLAKSDYLLADKDRAIYQVIYGSSGEMVVNGETYNTIMPPQGLEDEEVRDVINYILNAWGNNGGEVTLEDVQRVKGK